MGLGDAIRDSGTDFDGLPQLKAFLDQAALGVDASAGDLSRRSFSEMYDEVDAAVRCLPGLVAAAALMADHALFRALESRKTRTIPRSQAVAPVGALPMPDL